MRVASSNLVARSDEKAWSQTPRDSHPKELPRSVWYFGEEVSYYRNGTIFTTEGTWLAGRDGPPAMIMPGDPQVGDVHRIENIPGVAFEEVAIKTIGKTVEGPTGSVEGAIVGRELHDDGSYSDKVFAPGYGEFFSAHDGDVEAMALAIPTDALDEPVPSEIETLLARAGRVFEASRSQEWQKASEGVAAITAAWEQFQTDDVSRWPSREMRRAIDDVVAAVRSRHQTRAGTAAIDVAQAANDLRLRYDPSAEIDLMRLQLWARQILVDAGGDDLGAVTGDVFTIEWIRHRITDSLDPIDVTRIDTHLLALNDTVAEENLGAAARAAETFLVTLKAITLR